MNALVRLLLAALLALNLAPTTIAQQLPAPSVRALSTTGMVTSTGPNAGTPGTINRWDFTGEGQYGVGKATGEVDLVAPANGQWATWVAGTKVTTTTAQGLQQLVAPAPGQSDTAAAPTSFVTAAINTLQTYVTGLLQANYTLQVPSAASLRALAVFPGVLVHRGGYATLGDGGAADYAGSTSACPVADDGGSCLNAPGGSWRIDWASVNYVAPLPVFGAMCGGNGGAASADLAGANAAAATGRNVYVPANASCIWLGPVILPAQGQRIYGDGPQASKILTYAAFGGTPSSFTASAAGNILSVTAIASGSLLPGTYVPSLGAGVKVLAMKGPSGAANPYALTGTGSTGTYLLSSSVGTVASTSMTGTKFTSGVITFTAAAQEVRGIGISFQQPTSSGMAASALTLYEPGIYAEGQPATVIDNVLIKQGSTCIDLGGNANAGNSKVTQADLGCYLTGIAMDGALDKMTMRDNTLFPFSMSSDQAAVYAALAPALYEVGRTDHIDAVGGQALNALIFRAYPGTQGSVFGEFSAVDADGSSGFQLDPGVDSAQLSVSAFNCSPGAAGQFCLRQGGGRVSIVGFNVFLAAGTVPWVFSGGSLTLSAGGMNDNGFDNAMLVDGTTSSAILPPAPVPTITVSGVHTDRYKGSAYNNPVFSFLGKAVAVGSGNTASIAANGSGPFATFADNNGNRWFGNASPGYASYVANSAMVDSLTATTGGGKYFGN